MPKKKGVRVVVTGKPQPAIDIDAMTQIIIALGRELAAKNGTLAQEPTGIEAIRS